MAAKKDGTPRKPRSDKGIQKAITVLKGQAKKGLDAAETTDEVSRWDAVVTGLDRLDARYKTSLDPSLKKK